MNISRPKKDERGAVAIITILGITIVVLIVMSSVSVLAMGEYRMASAQTATEETFYSAEAGINEALYRLIYSTGQDFNLQLDDVSVVVTIDPNPNNAFQRIITSQATDASGTIRTLRIVANTNSFAGGFDYALQSGSGGIELLNNSKVEGDIYSNGNIFGGTGGGGGSINAEVDGNAWVAGGGPVTPGPEQINSDTEFAVASDVTNTDAAQSFSIPADAPLKKVSLLIKRVGNLTSDVDLKIVNDDGGSPGTDVLITESIRKNDFSTTTVWLDVNFDVGPVLVGGQKYWMVLDSPNFNAGKYLAWSLDSSNSYGDGEAKKSTDTTTGPWVSLTGDFSFKTATGLGDTFIRKVEILGDLHAHSIENSIITGDATYQIIDGYSSANVGGTQTVASAPGYRDFPIKQSDIATWKNEIDTIGTTIVGDVSVSGTQNYGFTKIEGNLVLDGSSSLVLSGNLWVTGDVTFTNPGASISLDASQFPDDTSGVLIADGKIDVNNNTTITGSGAPNTYVLMLSTNNSLNPSSPAINVANNSDSVIFYAVNGMVRLYNGSTQNGTTGYYVRLEENCSIIYDPNLNDFSVPGGGGDDVGTQLGTWEET